VQPRFCSACGQPLGKVQPVSTIEYAAEEITAPPSSGAEAETALPAPAEAVAGAAPQTVGGYRLLRELGRGGMGSVYEAEEISSGRRVALKLISASIAASRDAAERFRREGRLASGLSHPRCVFVLAADEEAGRPYIVMELMSGVTLEDLVKQQGPLPAEQAVARILDVIEGLEEAHRCGLIHRDVKPSNCFLDAEGRIKVGDFGLAKSYVAATPLTKTGSFLGTPLYASPEQIRAEPLDQQTDVYSVAATLYFLLTGQAPFQSGDAAATMARIVADPAPSMRALKPELSPALDDVVLRGLERNRGKRWRNLAEFKNALSQFVPGRLSIGSMGMRFGAYMIDFLVLSAIGMPLGFYFMSGEFTDPEAAARPKAVNLWGMLVWLLYFGLVEGVWGASLGKWLLHLRVRTASTGNRPGLARSLLRAAIFVMFFNLGTWLWTAIWLIYWPSDVQIATVIRDAPLLYMLVSFLPLLGMIAGVLLLWAPMRKRNGYRGLHEFLSGTRVIRLPWPERRRALAGRPPPWELAQPDECPAKLGAFVIRGALRWTKSQRLLAGEDPSLGRVVWIWLRPADDAPLSEVRREANRTTRLRWLAAGQQASWQWDAFLAPLGGPLQELIPVQGQLTWPEARPILEHLTDELTVACEEGTLPIPLMLEQLWIQPNGGVQLLDLPPRPTHDGTPEAGVGLPLTDDEPVAASAVDRVAETPNDAAQQRCLDLLARTAALLLEGRERAHSIGPPLRAPLPGHARQLLADLLRDPAAAIGTCQRFQKSLAASADQPAEVTRPRRLAHLAVQAAFLFLGLGCCMFPSGWLLELMPPVIQTFSVQELEHDLAVLERRAAIDCAVASSSPDPVVRLGGAAQLWADQQLADRLRAKATSERQLIDARAQSLSWVSRQQLRSMSSEEMRKTREKQRQDIEDLMAQQNPNMVRNYRFDAQHALSEPPHPTPPQFFETAAMIALVFWPSVWVIWAFCWRGGLSYRILQIAVVRRDGRPAGRLRCAWRALLVWAPLTSLLFVSLWLNAWYWSLWQPDTPHVWMAALSSLAYYSAALLLLAYVAAAAWLPTRSVHDRLAGTYLVPR
jgi:hypothetical protein